MLLPVAGIIIGLILLVYGADKFVEGASKTASNLGVSPMIIGLTIVGFATSAPEILVGSVAALDGKTNIAIGNALGSNITNIGLVLGCTAAFFPLYVTSPTLKREYGMMFLAMLLAALVMYDLELSQIDGLLLFIAMVILTIVIIYLSRKTTGTDILESELQSELSIHISTGRALLWLAIGLAMLLLGANILVTNAITIARAFGISDLIIGLTIVAIGTSLPELAASISSALKNEADIAVGNVIGSNMYNLLVVLGIPTIIHPADFTFDVLSRDFLMMLILTLMMGWMVFVHGSGKFTRGEGIALLACFCGYQYWLFIDSGLAVS